VFRCQVYSDIRKLSGLSFIERELKAFLSRQDAYAIGKYLHSSFADATPA
jgi:hypothetical protein